MTKIPYVNETWNVVTGCSPVSPGCAHCYARDMHRRLRSMGQPKYSEPFERVQFHLDELERPLHWSKPRRIFVNSMSDTFHPAVTDDEIARLWGAMRALERHTFIVVTKRVDRAVDLLPCFVDMDHPPWNIWLVATVEDQEQFDRRIQHTLMCPVAIRGLSIEPCLSPIIMSLTERVHLPRPDWVIVGCESGTSRRPCDNAWAIDIARQCYEADVPFFGKQFEIKSKISRNPQDWPAPLRHQMYPGDRWEP